MKLILVIDGESARYKYNAHTVFEYEDGTVSEDTRTIATDDREEFLNLLDLGLIEYESIQKMDQAKEAEEGQTSSSIPRDS